MADEKGARKFSELWSGFDVIFSRVTSGRHDFKTLKTYLDERAQIEETYARALLKLAKSPEFEVQSTLSGYWQTLKENTTTMAKQHSTLGMTLAKEVGVVLDKEINRIKIEKTKLQAEHKKLQADVEKKQANHDKCIARYREAVKQCDTAIINRNAGQKEQLVEKAQRPLEDRVKKCVETVDQTHTAYQEAVKVLKAAQENFDVKLKEHLEAFEQLERDRMALLQAQFKRLTEAHESLKNYLQDTITGSEKSFNEIAIERDLQGFISTHDPKAPPHPHVIYDPINSELYNSEKGIPPSSPKARASNSSFSPPPPLQVPMNNGPIKSPVAQAQPQPVVNIVKNESKAAPPANSRKASSNERFALALYDFESEEPTDLPFKTDDRIKIIDSTDENWWKGELNGRQGTFPANYVSVIGADEAVADQPKVMEGRCEALFDFVAQGADELSFKTGDILLVTGELNGWYLGKTVDGSRVGIFPSNYVTML